MVYVDDVIMFGSTSMVKKKKIIDAFQKPWKCRVTGIIPGDGVTIEEEVPTLVFLGMVMEVAEDKLMMHQKPYLENKLKKR
eukprot:6021815-Prorocentrum_lima.AAC.1